ncbi:MAG: hypothetical protein V7667_14875 [Alloalcanivorax venustensis]|jgi:hypothetical protein|uniref:hypothetical protein n=1 Tax=Alloalcanivorax venustensis TaxID=172371 RepID=UPI000E9864E6|nr:hypothetical protein [Alcanivorax sp.]|tara:strand:- start:377 stop:847 length:471 start_codon:yes stop_codon:yes gene_type:complete
MGQWKYLALAALLSGCTSQPANIESFQLADSVALEACGVECLRRLTRNDEGFQRYDANGWLVAVKMTEKDRWLWAFTPASHPANPAVIRRSLFWLPTASRIETVVLCGFEDEARCQAFLDEVSRNNDAIREMGYPEEPAYYMYEVIQTLREVEWGA